MMFFLLNLGSLIFGLASWIIPLVLLVSKKFPISRSINVIFASLVCVIIALMMQIFYTKHLVNIEDWSALMDTQGSLVLVTSVLSAVAFVLNSILMAKSLKSSSK
jgi:cytochrome c oxidase subunit 4